jgi:DNA-binding NarL/FixJ family response regulator
MLEEGQGFPVIGHARRFRPDAAVLVLSEFAAPHVARRCMAAGADAVFRKTEFAAFAQFVATRLGMVPADPSSWDDVVVDPGEASWNTAAA